jgi:hypothetical protein
VRRTGGRIAALGVLASAWLGSTVAASPAAFALHREDGDDPGPQISTLKALLIFGVVPVGISLLIALVVSLPSLAKGPRYRPGLGWEGTPEWYGGPEDADTEHHAVEGGYGGPELSSRSSSEAVSGRIVATGETGEAADGGSSAQW